MSLIKSSQIDSIEASKVVTNDSARFISKSELDKIKEVETLATQANTKADQADTKAEQANLKAEQAFQSASSGKKLVASAITDKGVQTDANDTYQTMATNISQIETSLPTQSRTVTPTTTDIQVLPDNGYSLEMVTVKGDADLVGSNIKAGINLFGVDGTFQGGQLDISGQVTKSGVFMTDVVKGDTVKAKATEGDFNEMIHHGIVHPTNGAGVRVFTTMSKSGNYIFITRTYGYVLYKKVGTEYIKVVDDRNSSYTIAESKFSNDEKFIYIASAETSYTRGLLALKIHEDRLEEIPISSKTRVAISVDVSLDDRLIIVHSENYGITSLYRRDGETFSPVIEEYKNIKGKRILFDKTGSKFIIGSSVQPFLKVFSIDEINGEFLEESITVPSQIKRTPTKILFDETYSVLATYNPTYSTEKISIMQFNDGNIYHLQDLDITHPTGNETDICFVKDMLVVLRGSKDTVGKAVVFKRNSQTLLFEKTNLSISGNHNNTSGSYSCAASDEAEIMHIINGDVTNPISCLHKLGGIETWVYKCTNSIDGSFSSFGYVQSDYKAGETGQYIEHFNR